MIKRKKQFLYLAKGIQKHSQLAVAAHSDADVAELHKKP